MMEIEKRFAKTDLSLFKANEFKEEPIKLLAKQIWEFQNFRNTIIAKKINKCGFKQSTIVTYIAAGLRYINTGVMSGTVNKLFFQTLEECKETGRSVKVPSISEKANSHRKFGIKRISKNTKVAKIVPESALKIKAKPLTESFEYGVRFDNTVKVFDTEKESIAFMQGYAYSGKTCKLVHITEAK